MDSGQDLADHLGNFANLSAEVVRATYNILIVPGQPDRYRQILALLSALPTVLSLVFVFVESLAQLDQQVIEFYTRWRNSNPICRGIMLFGLLAGLAQSCLPGIVSQAYNYLAQNHPQVHCWEIWRSSSFEVKSATILVVAWLISSYLLLPIYRWIKQGR